MTAAIEAGLREAALQAYEERAAEERRRREEAWKVRVEELRVNARQSLALVTRRAIEPAEIRVEKDGDSSLVARVDIDGLPLEVWPVRSDQGGGFRVHLRAPCCECGLTLTTGPQVRDLAGLGSVLVQGTPGSACAACVETEQLTQLGDLDDDACVDDGQITGLV